jgi:hypothetical protein
MASVKASLRLSMPIARDLSLVVIWFGLVC